MCVSECVCECERLTHGELCLLRRLTRACIYIRCVAVCCECGIVDTRIRDIVYAISTQKHACVFVSRLFLISFFVCIVSLSFNASPWYAAIRFVVLFQLEIMTMFVIRINNAFILLYIYVRNSVKPDKFPYVSFCFIYSLLSTKHAANKKKSTWAVFFTFTVLRIVFHQVWRQRPTAVLCRNCWNTAVVSSNQVGIDLDSM